MYKLDLEKAEEPEIKIPASVGSQRKQGNSRKTSTSASLTTLKALTVDHNKLWKILQEMGIPDYLSASCETYMQVKKQQLELDMKQQTCSKLGKEYVKAVYYHPVYLTYIQSESSSVVSDSLQPHELYSLWNSPGQNTGVGSLSLLQGIFPIKGSNPILPHCRQILYQLSRKGSPRILEWVAYRFSSGSSRPRNRTGVSCIAGRFFTS